MEQYLPLYSERARWSDRTKTIERTLFPGYVFGRFDLELRRRVVEIPGVVRILGVGLDPLPINDAEIDQVRRAAESRLQVTPLPYLVAGQKVRVEWGSLAGVEGVILRLKGDLHVVVSIEMLGRSVAVVLDTDRVAAIEPVLRAVA